MKKMTAILLLLVLLMSASTALADVPMGSTMEVYNCREYVTMRWEPDTHSDGLTRLCLGERVVCLESAENGFMLVSDGENWGYVLGKYLRLTERTGMAPTIDHELTSTQRYHINLFLSNFTETGFAFSSHSFNQGDDAKMIDFATDHIWFNNQNKLHWIDEYPDYNVYVDREDVDQVVKKYFGLKPLNPLPQWTDFNGESYRWLETGGHTPLGFAQVTSVHDCGDDIYEVFFEIYGGGDSWTNDCCRWTLEKARAVYDQDLYSHGYARIEAKDLSKYDSFRMIRYAFC